MKSTQPSQIARAATLPLVAVIAIVSGTSRADHVVSYNSPLVPPGLRPGDSFHLVFVTSASYNRLAEPTTHPANINYFNGLVNSAADSSSLPGVADPNWFAMVSTRSAGGSPVVVNARDNAVVSAPVYSLDDTRVATGVSDMWDGILNTALSINQNGASVSGSVWTGCEPYTGSGLADGIYALGGGVQGLVGTTTTNLGSWLANGSHTRQNTNSSLRLFALSERITIAVPPDADSDGMPDWFEQANTTPSSATSLVPGDDPDQDGISSLGEYGIDPRLVPTDPDTDGDGLLDGANIALTNTDPRYTAWVTAGIAYSDNAGTRTFRGESAVGTHPLIVDTDSDGLTDGVESNTGIWVSATNTGTNPLDRDTDNDSLLDQVETNTGTLVSKTNTGTNPLLADTDADGAGDWYEITATFTSPFLPTEKPNIPYPLPDPDATPPATNKPVKVFILSGQSNMVGIGYGTGTGSKPGSLEAITRTENKFPNLIDGAGNFTSRQDVWYEGVITATAKKWLSVGCGNTADNIGPELGFGHVMGWYLNEPVLIIKASQGNRSLAWDILPPTSPSHAYTDGKTYAGYGQSPNSWTTAGGAPSPFVWYAGKQYDDFFLDEKDMGPQPWAAGIDYPASCYVKHNGWTYISASAHTSAAATAPQVNVSGNPTASPTWNVYSVDNVTDVLDNFATRFASKGWAAQGFEIAGFAWFQGFGDQSEPNGSKYEENLTRLIHQTRSYYANRYPGKVAPQTPFAVATIGFGGQPFAPGTPSYKVHAAQLAVGNPAIHPEFTNNVKSVNTLPFWRELAESPGAQGFHYNNNAETYTLVGDALGRLMVDMLQVGSGPDTTPPAILTLNPADNATAAPVGANLVATFNEVIAIGTGDITIKNLTDTTAITIAVTDNSQVSVSGNVLTINPAALLIPGKNYAIRLTAAAIKDSAGNDFAGIVDDTIWNFSTPAPDLTAPSVFGLNPADGATDVALAANLVASFNEGIAIGTGSVTIKNLTDATQTTIAVTDPSQVSVSGSGLTINPAANLLPGKQYVIHIAAGAIKDLSDNPFLGIADDITWDFTTIPPDLTPPAIATLSPADNSTSASPGANLVLTFNEAIALGTGDVIIRNLTDTTETTIPITDAAQVSLAGSVLTINPASDLVAGKSYAVRIESGAIKDLGDNPFAGIGDDTTWNFTVATVPFVWTQTAGNAQDWTTGANWLGGGVPSPVAGDTVDFSSANIAANTTLTLDADRTAQLWKFGDATTVGHDWIVSATNKMILAGTTPTIQVVNRTTTLNNVVDGTAGLVKTGGGALTLGNTANTYTGGTTIDGGNLTIAGNGSLGSGAITINANTTISCGAGSTTYNRGIALNNNSVATLSLTANNGTATIAGAVTGSGGITVSAPRGLKLDSIANDFTGPIVMGSGIFYGSVEVDSLADSATPGAGKITLGSTTSYGSGSFIWGAGAASALALTNRQFDIASPSGSATIQNDNATAANTVTINSDLLSSPAGNKILVLGGANTGNNLIAGKIVNGGGTVSLTKTGAGTWIVSGANTFTGATKVGQGILRASTLKNYGADSALGAPASGTIQLGDGNTSGTLVYTGTGDTTNRNFQLGNNTAANTGGSTLNNNGSGALSFTATDFNTAITSITATRTLTLGGSYSSGSNQIQGVIRDNVASTGKVNLTKANDASSWILGGANTYTGTTTVSGGKLFINGDQTTANGNTSVAANATLGGTGIIGGNATIAATGRLEFNLSTPAASHDKLELAATRTLTFSGASSLIITSSGSVPPGDYTLVTAPGGFGTSAPPAAVTLPNTWIANAPRFVGNDLKINITFTGVVTDPYTTWAVGGVAFDADTNNDGIDNGMAWLLGAANPNTNATGLLPTTTHNSGNLVLTFNCLPGSERGTAILQVQHSSDMGITDTWAGAPVPGTIGNTTVSGIQFTVTDPGAPGGPLNVVATIQAGGSASGKLFGRLHSTPN